MGGHLLLSREKYAFLLQRLHLQPSSLACLKTSLSDRTVERKQQPVPSVAPERFLFFPLPFVPPARRGPNSGTREVKKLRFTVQLARDRPTGLLRPVGRFRKTLIHVAMKKQSFVLHLRLALLWMYMRAYREEIWGESQSSSMRNGLSPNIIMFRLKNGRVIYF